MCYSRQSLVERRVATSLSSLIALAFLMSLVEEVDTLLSERDGAVEETESGAVEFGPPVEDNSPAQEEPSPVAETPRKRCGGFQYPV